MQGVMPSGIVGPSLALGAFAVSMIAGLTVNNPFETAIGNALLAMGGCYIVGSIVGWAMDKVIMQEVERRVQLARSAAKRAADDGRAPGSARETITRK